jgi:hypothetical protein
LLQAHLPIEDCPPRELTPPGDAEVHEGQLFEKSRDDSFGAMKVKFKEILTGVAVFGCEIDQETPVDEDSILSVDAA